MTSANYLFMRLSVVCGIFFALTTVGLWVDDLRFWGIVILLAVYDYISKKQAFAEGYISTMLLSKEEILTQKRNFDSMLEDFKDQN